MMLRYKKLVSIWVIQSAVWNGQISFGNSKNCPHNKFIQNCEKTSCYISVVSSNYLKSKFSLENFNRKKRIFYQGCKRNEFGQIVICGEMSLKRIFFWCKTFQQMFFSFIENMTREIWNFRAFFNLNKKKNFFDLKIVSFLFHLNNDNKSNNWSKKRESILLINLFLTSFISKWNQLKLKHISSAGFTLVSAIFVFGSSKRFFQIIKKIPKVFYLKTVVIRISIISNFIRDLG